MKLRNLLVKSARILKTAVAIGLWAFIVLFVALCVYAGNPTVRYYDNYREAMQSNVLERTWIPDFFPKSATNIHVVYGVDPSFERLEFSYDPSDQRQMTETFRLVTDPVEAKSVLEDMNRKVWSQFDTDGATLVYVPKEETRHRFYNPEIYLAIDPKMRTAWYTYDK